jgi:hypothetical protein
VFATVHVTPPAGVRPTGTIEVADLDGAATTTIVFWHHEGDAPSGERVFRVVDGMDGVAAGRTPLFALITWLNGAGDPAVAEAADRGGRERVRPAVEDVEGLVGLLVLRSADDRIVVVGTATALETHTEMQERIMRTELLPGEDPALLPGPDRVQLGRVVRADVPLAVWT